MSIHNVGSHVLSGAAMDVMYTLFWHGAQDDGDVPSKGGMIELIEKGLARCDYSQPPANALTTEGYELARNCYRDERLIMRKSLRKLQTIHLDRDAVSGLLFHSGDPQGEDDNFSDVCIYIGTVIDEDDGREVYGLQCFSVECPEEGATTLVEMDMHPGDPDVPLCQITAPERIWLQHSDQILSENFPFPDTCEGVTWARDRQFATDVPYIREDLHAPRAPSETTQLNHQEGL